MRRIYRYELPVDNTSYTFWHAGPILRADNKAINVVEFWAENDPNNNTEHEYTVAGTGHPIYNWKVIASVPRNNAGLVWHICEVPKIGE